MKWLIRVDTNVAIGSGHVMRCLSIAMVARTRGIDCLFVGADDNTSSIVAQQHFKSINLENEWNMLEQELPSLLDFIKQEKITDILLDSYFVTPKYMQALRQAAHLHFVDDLMMFHYPCDTLINYNAAAPSMGYESEYGGCDTQLLLGPQYTPLRTEFQGLPQFMCKKEVRKILITTGGSDPLNIAGQLIQALKQAKNTSDLQLYVVSGNLNKNLPRLLQLQAKNAGVLVCQNVQNIAELMCSCDIAITAGGSTMYELCACGVPSVFFTFADNQLMAIEPFTDKLMLYAGDMRKVGIGPIADCVSKLSESKDMRELLSKKMQLLTDGQGASRIVDALSADNYSAK